MAFLTRITTFLFKNKRISLLMMGIVMALFGFQLTKLKADFSYRVWFEKSDQALLNYDRYQRDFGNEDSVAIGIYSNEGVLTPEIINYSIQLSDQLALVPNIVAIDSLSDTSLVYGSEDEIHIAPLLTEESYSPTSLSLDLKEKIINHPIVKNYFLSPDLSGLYLYGRMKPFLSDSGEYEKTHAGVQKLLLENPPPKGVEVYLTGDGIIIPALSKALIDDIFLIVPLLFLGVFLISFLIFRSMRVLLFEWAILSSTLTLSLGISVFLGHTFNPMTSLAVQVITAISLMDAIHIFSSFVKMRAQIERPEKCIEAVLKKNFWPTLLTSLTTSLGFLTLAWTDIAPIAELGEIVALGTLLAWLSTYFFAPIVIPGKGTGELREVRIPFGPQFVRVLNHWKLPVVILIFLLVGLSVQQGMNQKVNANTIDLLAKENQATLGYQFFKKNLGVTSGVDVVIEKGNLSKLELMRKMSELKKEIETRSQVVKTLSLASYLHEFGAAIEGKKSSGYLIPRNENELNQLYSSFDLLAHQIKEEWVTHEDQKFLLTVFWSTNGSRETNQLIADIESLILKHGLVGEVMGKSVLVGSINGYLVKTFFQSIALAVLLLFFVMWIYLKDLKFALLSLIPNVLPLALGLGFMGLADIDLNHSTVMVFSICLGIAIDDTIHFLTALKECPGESWSEKILESLQNKGSTLIETSLILVLSFFSFLLGEVSLNTNFGLLIGVMITLTLLFDLVFLPMLILFFEEEEKVDIPLGEVTHVN